MRATQLGNLDRHSIQTGCLGQVRRWASCGPKAAKLACLMLTIMVKLFARCWFISRCGLWCEQNLLNDPGRCLRKELTNSLVGMRYLNATTATTLTWIMSKTNWNLAYTTRQGSRVSCLAQTGFAAFGKGVQLVSGSPYAEIEQLSRLTSPNGILATSWC